MQQPHVSVHARDEWTFMGESGKYKRPPPCCILSLSHTSKNATAPPWVNAESLHPVCCFCKGRALLLDAVFPHNLHFPSHILQRTCSNTDFFISFRAKETLAKPTCWSTNWSLVVYLLEIKVTSYFIYSISVDVCANNISLQGQPWPHICSMNHSYSLKGLISCLQY